MTKPERELIDYTTTVPCRFCGTQTPLIGIKQCHNCWTLYQLVRENPDAARKILAEVEGEKQR